MRRAAGATIILVLAGIPASANAGEQVLYEAAAPQWAKPVDLAAALATGDLWAGKILAREMA